MSTHSRFRYGSYGSSNTNNSLFKVAIAAAGFFAGALVGAYLPDLILKSPTRPPSSTTTADDTDAPLCSGPECATAPSARLPSTALALAPPSPYESSRLAAVRSSASSSATVGDLEMYALLLHFLHEQQGSEGGHAGVGGRGGLYSDPQESTPALLAHLTLQSFDVSMSSSSLTLSSLRSLVSANTLVLARVQVGDEGRWLAVVAVDAFYVYAVDVYTPSALVCVPTREFSKYWWEMDAEGKRQTNVAMIVKPPPHTGEGRKVDSAALQRVPLVQLKLDNAPEEHPAVEMASL